MSTKKPVRSRNPEMDTWSELAKARNHVKQALERAKIDCYARPLAGWSQEKHDKYYAALMADLSVTERTLHALMMKISPD